MHVNKTVTLLQKESNFILVFPGYMTELYAVLNKYGYHYRQARRKGLLTESDLKLRMKFAKDITKYYDDGLWSSGICFYLDAKHFIHKTNPMDQAKAPKRLVWREKNEGLIKGCTSKENKAGHGGKVASFFVAISLVKGICYCKHYEKLSGTIFAEFIENNFIEIFKSSCNPAGNVFVQVGDPSQNSKAAKTALEKIGAVQFSIPPRSPDLNPIENVFNLVEKKLGNDAVRHSISKETYARFVERVENTLLSYPVEPIDNIIKCMSKRISQVIKCKGKLKF